MPKILIPARRFGKTWAFISALAITAPGLSIAQLRLLASVAGIGARHCVTSAHVLAIAFPWDHPPLIRPAHAKRHPEVLTSTDFVLTGTGQEIVHAAHALLRESAR